MQKAVILNACYLVRNFLAENWIRSIWSARPYYFEKWLHFCKVRKVDDDDDDDDDDDTRNTSISTY
jgi:hypothetical protein